MKKQPSPNRWTRPVRTVATLAVVLLTATAAMAQAPKSDETKPQIQTAIFAAGCFWCVEEAFDKVEGVVETTSGYTGGTVANPTYEQVSSGGTGHTEALEVRYDPSVVRYEALLDTFWRNVDMFDAGGQFCDRGVSYETAVFVRDAEQRRIAEASKAQAAADLGQPIVTRIEEAATFYPAEDYHQDYYTKNPLRYRLYRWNCGRNQRVEEVWGDKAYAGVRKEN